VLNRGDRVPIAGVDVLLDDGATRAVTDAKGEFAFDAVVVGTHAVHLRGPLAAGGDFQITLSPGKRTTATYYVFRKERYASTVRGRRAVQETVEQTLSPRR
jgi:hypothetical protein